MSGFGQERTFERVGFVPPCGSNAPRSPWRAPQKLIVNLKIAKALGVEIPKAVLFRADEVIQ